MIEANYCLNAADFADMAALRRRLTRITPILFFCSCWIWLCSGGL